MIHKEKEEEKEKEVRLGQICSWTSFHHLQYLHMDIPLNFVFAHEYPFKCYNFLHGTQFAKIMFPSMNKT
jgi:hypothetical protein